ncbi:hypothetical protein GOBAR_DD09647 [Gossypium barbadense]|nr:hypothetical protein GOBAR_DD09647 [Gossypium barbadense]
MWNHGALNRKLHHIQEDSGEILNMGIVKFNESSRTGNLLPNYIDEGVNATYEKVLRDVHINAMSSDINDMTGTAIDSEPPFEPDMCPD